MKTDVAFIDEQCPGGGRLWVVAGGPASGRSSVLMDMATGVASSLAPEGRIAYWDLQRTAATWEKLIATRSKTAFGRMDYRNEVSNDFRRTLNEKSAGTHRVLVLDTIELMAGVSDLNESFRFLKHFAVRRNVLVLASVQLPRWAWYESQCGSVLEELPAWLTVYTDAIFLITKPTTPEGSFRLIECRGTQKRFRTFTVCPWDTGR